MRILCTRFVAIFALALLVAGASSAAVVTLDFTTGTAKSDTKALLARANKSDRQIGVYMQNTTLEPQAVALRVTGLKEVNYDVYVNNNYVSSKTSASLMQGMQVSIPGTPVSPGALRCFRALKPKVESEYTRASRLPGNDESLAAGILREANNNVIEGLETEEQFRTGYVTIAPQGLAIKSLPWENDNRDTAELEAAALSRGCYFLQQGRAMSYDMIKDPAVRDATVAAMTPVDFTADYSIRNGKPHIDAALVNDCNLTITGDIAVTLPSGWKSTAKSTAFRVVSGATFTLSFDLVPPAPGALAPTSPPPVAANVRVAQENLIAKFTLKAKGK